MTKEEKDLIFQEICERLPYRPLVKDIYYNLRPVPVWLVDSSKQEVRLFADEDWTSIENVRLYLRPMNSMTRDEWEDYREIEESASNILGRYKQLDKYDWLRRKHFDFRNLIEKGLALEASTEIYEDY